MSTDQLTSEILRMENLVVTARAYGAHQTIPIIKGVSLSLKRGEVVGLIGESGAGKSTIGLAALGYTRPGSTIADGKILFDGADIRKLSAGERRKLRGRRVAYIAQSAAASFNPAMRLDKQVCEAPVRHGLARFEIARSQAVQLYRELDLPTPETFGSRYPHQASGGQLQRAMAAMAMSCRPDILVLDEPTTALDVTTQIEVLASIRQLIREHHTAGLYITHDLAVVAQIADRIIVLRDGSVVEEGTTEQILNRPRAEYTQALVSTHSKDVKASGSQDTAKKPVLELSKVSARYAKAVRVVENVDLSVRKGETVAVVGESGSGKSTLARVITGLLPRETGQIIFQGDKLPPTLAARNKDLLRRIQLIYQMPDVALNPRQKVSEIIGRPLQFYRGLKGAALRERVAELLSDINLSPDYAERLPGQLSGGQKQRICIARALAAEPDLIICDEVTSALDPLVAEGILDLLAKLQRTRGYAYMFITHDLGVVGRIADRVAVMLKGEIVAQGSIAEVFSWPCHPYTERLLSSVPEMDTHWLDNFLANRSVSLPVTS
ncbi:ABC transporter ATP-binding protein [Rhizobium calliandrae]|uniref:ABC transporter ATP-binding protein n=1 Tax=Rhizobium calliandrae TaxID=1312182 RepID=A0ABT7KNY0_9HYPH|nr:ABC transporter ATP-binding protein [Rhizobium calliandrae]MDL2410319.1 ABC transporter ATP-binding protein [Rhizobium calliandrae]